MLPLAASRPTARLTHPAAARPPARLAARAPNRMSAPPPTICPPTCLLAPLTSLPQPTRPLAHVPGRPPARSPSRPPSPPRPTARPLARSTFRPVHLSARLVARPNAPPPRMLARSLLPQSARDRSVASWRDGFELDAVDGGNTRLKGDEGEYIGCRNLCAGAACGCVPRAGRTHCQ